MKVELSETADFRTVPGDRRLFRLLSNFVFWVDSVPFVIPAGFVTDFASVPKFAEGIISNNEPQILRAALAHDWLYQSGGKPTPDIMFTRSEADEILREGMRSIGASFAKRWLVWVSVRVGGVGSWNPHILTMRALTLRTKIRRATTLNTKPEK